MRYNDTAVNKFWRIGYKMFHGKWHFPLIEQLIFFPSKHSLNVWSLLVCSDTLSSKWVNIPGRIWLDGTGDSEVPVTFANGWTIRNLDSV
jgi:hypothetical protein